MNIRYWVRHITPFNFSNTNNWSLTSGGPGGASVPGAGDIAIFDDNSHFMDFVIYIDVVVQCRLQFLMSSNICVVYIADGGYVNLTEPFGSPLVLLYLIFDGTSKFFASNNYDITLYELIIISDSAIETEIFNFGSSFISVLSIQVLSTPGNIVQGTLAGTTITNLEYLYGSDCEGFIFGKLYISFNETFSNAFISADNFNTDDILELLIEELHVSGDGTLNLCNFWWRDEYYKILNPGGLSFIGDTPGGLVLAVAEEGYSEEPPIPLFAHFIMESGIATAENCTLNRNIASGGATFNSWLTKGNIDDGENEGWIWDEPPPPPPPPPIPFGYPIGAYNEGNTFALAPGDDQGIYVGTAVWFSEEFNFYAIPITPIHSPGCGYWWKVVGRSAGPTNVPATYVNKNNGWLVNKGEGPWKI